MHVDSLTSWPDYGLRPPAPASLTTIHRIGSSFRKLTVYLGAASGLSLLLGFITQLYILITLGPGIATDAYFASLTLPQVVLAVVSTSLTHVLVPLLTEENEHLVGRHAWSFFLTIGASFAGLAILLAISAGLWVPLLVPGFSEAGKALATELTRIQLIGMVFTALWGVQMAANHARKRFVWPDATSPIAGMASLALLVWALPRYGIVAAAWITVFRFALPSLLLLPSLGPFRGVTLPSELRRQVWQRLRPLLAGNTYYKSGIIVDRFFASLAPAGGLSLLNLGQQIYGGIFQLLGNAIVSPAIPYLATQAKKKEWSSFRSIYRKRLKLVVAMTLAGLLLLALIGRPVIQFALTRGDVLGSDSDLLYRLMLALGGFVLGGVVGQVLASAFYAHGDTRSPVRIGVLGFTLSILFRLTGFWIFGLIGLALAASLHQCFNGALLYVGLDRKINRLEAG